MNKMNPWELPDNVRSAIIEVLTNLNKAVRNAGQECYIPCEYRKTARAIGEYIGALKIAKILGIDETLLM